MISGGSSCFNALALILVSISACVAFGSGGARVVDWGTL